MNKKQEFTAALKSGILGLIFTYIAFLPAYYYLNLSSNSPFFSFPDFIHKNWDKLFIMLIISAVAALILLMNRLGIKTRTSDSKVPREYRVNYILLLWLYICSILITVGLIFLHNRDSAKISWMYIALFYTSFIILAIISLSLTRRQSIADSSSKRKTLTSLLNLFTVILSFITLLWFYIAIKTNDAQLWKMYISKNTFLITVTSISTLIAFFFGYTLYKIKSNSITSLIWLNIILLVAFAVPIFILQSNIVKLKYDVNMPQALGLTEQISNSKAICINKKGEVTSYLSDPNVKTYLTKENITILQNYTDNNHEQNFLNLRAVNMLLNYYILKGDIENTFATLAKAHQTSYFLDSQINSAIGSALLIALPYAKKLTPYAKYYTNPENSIKHINQYSYLRALSEKYGLNDQALYYKNLSNISEEQYRDFLKNHIITERGTIKGRIILNGKGLPNLSVRAIRNSNSAQLWRTKKTENKTYLDLNSGQDVAGYYYARSVFPSYTEQDGSFTIERVPKGEYAICILLEGENSKLSVKKSVNVPLIEKGTYNLGNIEMQ